MTEVKVYKTNVRGSQHTIYSDADVLVNNSYVDVIKSDYGVIIKPATLDSKKALKVGENKGGKCCISIHNSKLKHGVYIIDSEDCTEDELFIPYQ